MKEFKGTKGTFKDGTTGWKYYSYKEDERVGFSTHEIHWSDDGECVAEVVHDEANAKLIAAAPELLGALLETDKDLCILWAQILELEETNPRAEGLSDLIKVWRDRNKIAINKALN